MTTTNSHFQPDVDSDVERSLKALGLNLQPIPRLCTSNTEDLRTVITTNRVPVVFNGLINEWAAYKEWSPENLTKNHGEKLVTALVDLPSKGVFFLKDQRQYERKLTLSEFIDLVLFTSAERPCYWAYQRDLEIFSAQDNNFGDLLGDLNTEWDTRGWLGSAGTRSMLHSDLKDNLFCQIWGEKKVILVPWDDSLSAYPCPDNIVNSQLDLANVDLKRYPKLKKTTLYTTTMKPGDMLFIPRAWWHDIRSQTPSISLSHWFGPPVRFQEYAQLILKLGPRCWGAVAKSFFKTGILKKPEQINFFFSPASTGKRLYDLFKWGDFSKNNDPTTDDAFSVSDKKEGDYP